MSNFAQKTAPDNYADVAKYIDWINKTILDNGGMSSCGYTIAAVQTADTTDTIEASASITATTSPTTNIEKKSFSQTLNTQESLLGRISNVTKTKHF